MKRRKSKLRENRRTWNDFMNQKGLANMIARRESIDFSCSLLGWWVIQGYYCPLAYWERFPLSIVLSLQISLLIENALYFILKNWKLKSNKSINRDNIFLNYLLAAYIAIQLLIENYSYYSFDISNDIETKGVLM